MKKILSLLMAAAVLCAMTACADKGTDDPAPPAASMPTELPGNASPQESVSAPDTSEPDETEKADEPDDPPASAETGSGILVAYFTYMLKTLPCLRTWTPPAPPVSSFVRMAA